MQAPSLLRRYAALAAVGLSGYLTLATSCLRGEPHKYSVDATFHLAELSPSIEAVASFDGSLGAVSWEAHTATGVVLRLLGPLPTDAGADAAVALDASSPGNQLAVRCPTNPCNELRFAVQAPVGTRDVDVHVVVTAEDFGCNGDAPKSVSLRLVQVAEE